MNVRKISLEQYLESKAKLRECVEKVPVVETTYFAKKYCKFPTGSKETKQILSLKPADALTVTWKYADIHHRTAEQITINEHVIDAFWKNEKIETWLLQNCVEDV